MTNKISLQFKILMMKSCCFETCCVRLRLTQYLRTPTESASPVCSSQLRQKKSKQTLFFIFVSTTLISKTRLERFLLNSTTYLLVFVTCECRVCEIQTSYRLERPPRNGSIQEVRPDMVARPAAAASSGYRGWPRGSLRDRGSDEKYSDINGRLSRKTGRPGHCHYIQVESIQNLNFLFEYSEI